MAFYQDNNTENERNKYEMMLQTIGSLSRMFSDNLSPYLDSRITENLFCRYLNAINLARGDVTADAKKGAVGIGIKTWVGGSSQKIAEFDAERANYIAIDDIDERVRYIARLRNDRINMTMRTYGLNQMIYHCTVRSHGLITIGECPLIPIDIDSIHNIVSRDRSCTFEDNYNKYSFNYSKSTLYKNFSNLDPVKELHVNILEDPFETIYGLLDTNDHANIQLEAARVLIGTNETQDALLGDGEELIGRAILPLYSTRAGNKYVPEKNNLNIRFANGRRRDPYEVGIPIPADFRHRFPAFFPGRDCPFRLVLPDGSELTAKQCQDDGKALMSNPNNALGHWLIDTVFQIEPETPFTYEFLERYGIDSVELSKIHIIDSEEIYYKISFAVCGSYENFMQSIPLEE